MAKSPEPVQITTAARSRRDEIATRQRRYLISMGIRTVCFVLAVLSIPHWFLWVFIVGSLVLPYVAVVLANAGSPLEAGHIDSFDPEPPGRAIEGPRESSQEDRRGGSDQI